MSIPIWRRVYPKAAGSLPGGVITQWGVALLTIFFLVFLAWWIYAGRSKEEAAAVPGTDPDRQAPRSFAERMAARVEEEGQRKRQRQSAAERDAARSAVAGGISGGRVSAMDAMRVAGNSEDTGGPYTEEEWKLQERLRLEEMERRRRSLRSEPVAHSYRRADGRAAEVGPAQEVEDDTPAASAQSCNDAALERALDSFGQATATLEAEAKAAEAALMQADLPPTATPRSASPTAVPPPAPPPRDYSDPPRVEAPEDPPGWERIHEGSFLEAALVTQLSGDFPGPVLAVVSVPFYSGDRQRILIPRGARIIGTAQDVTQQDQERLAVSFHRLIFPDGRWVSLEFHGLNQVGEGALRDQVNRHYLSMFTAVGAIGVLSGLTLRGSDPYAGGAGGFRAGAGQGLAQTATQILQRFLNRLPTITIRAGHRLRVWFTSDVLVPRPQGELK